MNPHLALASCQLLHLIALRLFSLAQGPDRTGWFALGLVGLLPMLVFDDESKHGAYLLFKYFTFVLYFGLAGRAELAVASVAAVPVATWLYTLSHGTHWGLAVGPQRELSRASIRPRVSVPAARLSIPPSAVESRQERGDTLHG